MKRARPTFPHRTKTSQILHCRASFFFFFNLSWAPTHVCIFATSTDFFFRVQTVHSDEPKLLPAALKMSLANCFSPTTNLEEGEGSQICEVESSLLSLPPPPIYCSLSSLTNSCRPGKRDGRRENKPCFFFSCRLSWQGRGAFFPGQPISLPIPASVYVSLPEATQGS